jgi:hypothetical protein
MNTKTILTTLLLFFITTSTMAQDKYEFATITYLPINRSLETSINGINFESVTISKERVKGDFDTNAALEKVNTMCADGWELFNTASTSVVNYRYQTYVFF